MSGLLRKLNVLQRPAGALTRHMNRIDSVFLGVQSIFGSTIRSKKFLVKTRSELFYDVHEQRSNEATIKSLEAQLKLLTANGNPTHGVLKKLFSEYVQIRRHNDALRIEKMFEKGGVVKTAGYYADSIRLHTDLGDVHKALEYLKIIEKNFSYFKIDAYKLINLASLLIKNDRYDEAIVVLNSFKPYEDMKEIIDNMSLNIQALLTSAREYAVRNGKSENVSGQLIEMLSKKNLCKTSNVNLGQIVKEFLDKKDLRNAIAYHLKFVKKYRSTPEAFTLIIELNKIVELDDKPNDFQIKKSEATEFLQNILNAHRSVHGRTKTNAKLILALAFNRNYDQLRKLMLHPDFKFDLKSLIESLKYFRDRSDFAHTGLSETIFYEILLSQFVNDNDYESAIQFYNEIVVRNDAILSKALAKRLAHFLEQNKQEIPEQLRSLIY